MRAFKPEEESALLFLASAPGSTWRDLPAAPPGPSVHNRIAKLGLASIMVTGPHRRARLTQTGRYFADLVARKASEPSK